MNLKQTIAELKKAGTAQNRKVYARHGVQDPMFGVSYAVQTALTKKNKMDHELALGLWDSGIHDARVLATMIADPEAMNAKTLESWIKELKNYVLTDAFAKLAAKTRHAETKAAAWIKSKNEWIGATGWTVISVLEMDPEIPDAYFEQWIPVIESGIQSAPNRKKHSMNQALISIGSHSDALQKKASAAALRIGPVKVDHGETGCKTPEAVAYIEKTRQHRKSKAAKKLVAKKAPVRK